MKVTRLSEVRRGYSGFELFGEHSLPVSHSTKLLTPLSMLILVTG